MFDDFKTLVIATISLIIIIVALTFIIFRTPAAIQETIIIEDEINTQQELEAVVDRQQTQLTVQSFGGEKNVKTFFENDIEYALLRNPQLTGDFELMVVDPFGNYYYEQEKESRIVFDNGDTSSKYGYNEIAEVSGELLRELNTDTEYFIAYPDSLSAGIAGIPEIPDSGASNRFLQTQLAVITNVNNNITVVAKIVHRGEEQGVLPVSERTRKSLGLDKGSIGNLKIGLLDSDKGEIGVILPSQK